MNKNVTISTKTARLLLEALSKLPGGAAGVALGQDLVLLNKPDTPQKRTEKDILEEHVAEKAKKRTND